MSSSLMCFQNSHSRKVLIQHEISNWWNYKFYKFLFHNSIILTTVCCISCLESFVIWCLICILSCLSVNIVIWSCICCLSFAIACLSVAISCCMLSIWCCIFCLSVAICCCICCCTPRSCSFNSCTSSLASEQITSHWNVKCL